MTAKRKLIYDKSMNIKLTEKQYQQLAVIRENTGISVSKLMRDNLAFLVAYHTKILK